MDIRKILDIVTEAEKPLAKGMKVMSPSEFLQSQGIEPKSSEEGVAEGHADQQRKIFKKNGKPIGEVGIDRESSPGVGQYYMKHYASGTDNSGYDSFEEALGDLKYIMKQSVYGELKQGVAEGAPELLKQEMPLVRHIEKELEQHGYEKGTAEYDEKFKHAIAFYRKFGNIDAIKQSVAEDLDEAKLDVSARPFPKDELIKYLDRVVGEPILDKEGKPKLDKKGNPQFKSLKTKTDKYKFPYIHRSNVPIVNQDGQKYDLDKLASLFTERPSKILKQNEKMQHSDGTASQFYNVGLPALIGLAVDEDKNEFVVINTCPGAGNCKLVCYAMKGGYIQYPASNLSQTRLLNFLYNDPDGFMGMLENEIAGFEAKNSKKNIKTIIRWHDAGDFFSPEYLDKAYNLAKKFPDVDFYAYTKLASVAQGDKPDNFKINFSMGAQPSQEKKIDFAKTKNSRIVPEVIFADLLEKDKAGKWQYKNPQAQQAVKDRIAAKYSLDPKSIITYDEMMKIPVDRDPQAKGKWNVIVKPGDGDDAANRNDVLSSLLLIH